MLGTRPEIIKMTPVVKELENRRIDTVLIHSGQHYSYNMSELFFMELGLRKPDYDLDVKSKSPLHQGEHIGRMLAQFDDILIEEKPDFVVVHGDTNTTLAGALSAAKLKIRLGHVEAGLRSFDRTMPEELNRIIADSLSDILFAPTENSKANLLKENTAGKIHVTGNTIVDVINSHKLKDEKILGQLNLAKKNFMLLTAHRQENVDSKKRFSGILNGMEKVYEKFGMNIVYPIHPRSRKMINELGITVPEGLRLIDPVGYNDFLALEKNASIIFTDSGGVQEEACILGTPCVTLRDNTERPETIDVGSNILAGTQQERIVEAANHMSGDKKWRNPFGDGNTSRKIVDIVEGK